MPATRFKKRVNGSGVYQTPDGPAVVTPERLKHWHETISAILARGYKPPLSWGHHKDALPHSEADAEFWRSRFAAGRVVGSELDAANDDWTLTLESDSVERTAEGKLVSTATLEDGRPVRTEAEDVSVGAMDWTDGDGKVWKDAPVHLALTPLPVWVPPGGQPPFAPADGLKLIQFGTRLYRFASEPPMADDKKPPKKDDEPAEGGGPPIKKVIEMLGKAGIPLPTDTTAENLLERLYVAATAVTGNSGGAEPPAAEPKEADATFMSTIRADPVGVLLLAELEGAHKEKRLGRIEALAKRGLPAHRAKALREEATKVRFAATAQGTAQPQAIDRELDALDAVLPPEGSYADLLSRKTPDDVRVAAPPEGEDKRTKHKALADELAGNGRARK